MLNLCISTSVWWFTGNIKTITNIRRQLQCKKCLLGSQKLQNTSNKNIKSHQKEHKEWKFIWIKYKHLLKSQNASHDRRRVLFHKAQKQSMWLNEGNNLTKPLTYHLSQIFSPKRLVKKTLRCPESLTNITIYMCLLNCVTENWGKR